jgi:Holliday junction resolvase YEN1
LPPAFKTTAHSNPSIYGEIGPGERIALSKLAIEKFEETGRPLRIAIDVSIWQFQTQAGQGGSNPAIRTFYYRLQRLISTSIQAVFIFDGPHKPPFKRNKRTGQNGAVVPNLLTKQLLKLFGFPFYMAPGEAEAECALLQREGIVDAVLSEDVDTLMFGCGRTLRNWSSEGSRGNKSPTHVSVYDAKATKEGRSGLDREGMVLIALMSGGDYITEGIPGCGIKVACEAARAGYGKSLCQILRSDTAGMEAWRQNIAHEIRTNESKHFRVKHKTLQIPDGFPNREVLGYYTHPVVSSASKIQKLKEEIAWDGEVDVQGLRLFVAEAFDWTHKTGAKKFIRGMAPAILIHKLRTRSHRRDSEYGDVILTAMNEMELVRAICGKRNHFSTDGIPELRVIYHPAEIMGIDLDAEEDDSGDYGRDGLAPVNDDNQIEEYVSDDGASRSRSTSPSKRAASKYDPTQPDKAWIPEIIAKVGIPLKVEDYEESLRDPRKFIRAKAAAKRAATKGGMPTGAMDRFVKITKPVDENGKENGHSGSAKPPRKTKQSNQHALPPVYLAPTLERLASSQPDLTSSSSRMTRATRLSASSSTGSFPTKPTVTNSTRSKKVKAQKPAPNTNPWTLAASSPQSQPRIQKHLSQEQKSNNPRQPKQTAIYIDSSPPAPASSPPTLLESPSSRKHQHSPTPPSDHGSDTEPQLPPTVRLTRGPYTPSKEPGTPIKSRQGIDRPSPRKKISPNLSGKQRSAGRRAQLGPLRPEPVARKLDFTGFLLPEEEPPALSSNTNKMDSLAQTLVNQVQQRNDQWPEYTNTSETVTNETSSTLSETDRAAVPENDMERAMTSSPALPSISDLAPATAEPPEIVELASSSPIRMSLLSLDTLGRGEMASPPKPKPKSKKYFVVRDSLDGQAGHFFELDEEKVRDRGRAYRYSQVEVLDLTGGD